MTLQVDSPTHEILMAGLTQLSNACMTPEKRAHPIGASEANRIEAALGVGKQSLQYKRVKAVLEAIIP